ncbi:uncharacterized protein LOC123332729 isoform X1 [Bubalus bubalis]|uniref:uncharacterized protein LOC123332729 isoform X1 n=1 Tax=Bubalus bubalis TaxID=89462 RepID=UPI001E1B9C44|nr:uncharacterized protein LOC123332729 isoform X1 [Bubalus bubalis]
MELRLPLELFMGFQAPCQTVCGICRFFQTMHGGVSDPSFCVFIHRVAFEEVSGHRVLMKSGPGYRGRSAFGTTHVGCLEFPHETGLILKCAAKVMKLFQTKQRNRPSCGDQEGRSGSDEVLLGTSVFPSSETDSRKSWRCALVTEGKRDPTKACVQDLMFMSRLDRNLGVAFQTHLGVRPQSRGEAKDSALLSSRTGMSWSPLSGLKGVKPPLVFGGRTRDCSPGNA